MKTHDSSVKTGGNELLTEADVAKLLRVQPRTVRLWRGTRGLPFLRLTGKVIRFREGDVLGWVDESRTCIVL